MSHTPGPWTIRDHTHDEQCLYIEAPSDGIATVFDSGDHYKEDAHLISAAPDLLDACNGLLGLLQLLSGRSDMPAEIRDAMFTSHRTMAAQEAIAKAEGAQ